MGNALLQANTYGVVNSKLRLKSVGSHSSQYAAGLNQAKPGPPSRVGARPLAMAPVVDEEGYRVVTTPKKASKPPKVQRLDTLKLKSLKASKKGDEDEDEGEWEEAPKTPWGHLGGCW